jgi:L-amino acid N-acyltransferase YncA
MSDVHTPAPVIRDATRDDAAAIVTIYNHFVQHTIVTFEEEPVAADEIVRRMESVWSADLPWLVAEEMGQVIGYAYATKWKERIGYRFSVETSVYLAPDAGGRGVGSALYRALFPRLDARGVHVALGGIALPNDASIALHEKMGMHKVAHFEQTGRKFGRWIDVGYWQRALSDAH